MYQPASQQTFQQVVQQPTRGQSLLIMPQTNTNPENFSNPILSFCCGGCRKVIIVK